MAVIRIRSYLCVSQVFLHCKGSTFAMTQVDDDAGTHTHLSRSRRDFDIDNGNNGLRACNNHDNYKSLMAVQ